MVVAKPQDLIWEEIDRMCRLARDPNVTDLLGALLGGQERSIEHVKKIVIFVTKWTCSDWPEQERILKACTDYLTNAGYSRAANVFSDYAEGKRKADLAGFDIHAAMKRIVDAGFENGPGPVGKTWSKLYAIEVLNTALGGEKLTEESCRRMWRAYKALPTDSNCERPRAAEEIAACVCKVANAPAGGFGWDMNAVK
jgi:hypothetical protein